MNELGILEESQYILKPSRRTQDELLLICMFGDLSSFHLDSVIPSFLCCRGQTCSSQISLPELSCPGHVPEKLPAGSCSGILGCSQQETNLFLFWANFSLYDSPSVLFWSCRSCAGMSNIPVRAQGTGGALRALLEPKLFWHQQGKLQELFRMDICQAMFGWIFVR